MFNLIAWFRISIMGNPIKSQNNSTAVFLVLDQLFYNIRFDLFALIILIILAVITFVAVTRRRRGLKEISIYITGAFIIFSALEYRYISKIIGSDIAIHNIQTANRIVQAITDSKNYLIGFIGAYLGTTIGNNVLVNTKNPNLITRNYLLDGQVTSQQTDSKNTDNKLGSNPRIVVPKKKENKSTSTIHNKKTYLKKKEGLNGSTDNGQKNSKKELDEKAKAMIVDNEENMPKSSATGTSKFSPTKDQFKQQNSKNIGATVISIPYTLDGDVYLQNLMKVFSREFTQNNNISTSFTTILESKDHILKELTRFDNNFRKFYSTSMNIEKEMASFNANPRYFQYEVSDMSSALKEALSVTTVLDYLNYKNGSDLELNKIFQSEKARQRRSFNVVENVNSYFWLRCMRICAAIQIALGFTLLIVILYEIEFISVLVFFTFLLLFVNAMFSLYVMALAQTLDRMCILWNVDGCPSGYTEGFTRFAATANLDMSSKGHSLQIGEALNKIEVRTAKVVEILREYIQGNPRGRFEYRAMVVQNLFDKIFFVRDEFRKLTNNQVDKESFYKNLDEMDQEIHALRKNIEQLKNDDLLDFYTREVIFLNFIRGEKRNLLRHISDQFNSGGIKGTGICAVRRARICANKALVDRLSALMLIGSIILAVLYCI